MRTDLSDAAFAEAIVARLENHPSGFSLEREFYTSEAIYELDLKKVWGANWIWAGHASQVPNAGDYFLFEFGYESIIIARDASGDIRGHLNVCRHRGSRVCLEPSGSARSFTCPYHAWTYNLDGSLRRGPFMPEGFERGDFGLHPVHVIDFQGLIFICLAENPPKLADNLEQLAPLTKPFGLADMKVAHQQSYPVPANWKLAEENYRECYHCAPSHRDYSISHSLKDERLITPELMGEMNARCLEIGLPIDDLVLPADGSDEIGTRIYYRKYPLLGDYVTGSKSGKGVAPPLGDLTGYANVANDISFGGLNHFLAYCDHVVGYRFLPKGCQQTEIQTVWMVRGDAEEGKDYDLEELKWLWHVTTLDDERIIRHNQEGVNSFHYRPGPLSEMEYAVGQFYQDYARYMAAAS